MESVFLYHFVLFDPFLTLFLDQAFSTLLDRAISGNSSNVTAADFRAMVTMAYLSSNPDFPALNLALYGALNGNWSGLSYGEFGPAYTEAFFPVLQTVCLDQRELPCHSSPTAHLLAYFETDVDNNTFAGFHGLRQRIADSDTAKIEYSQDLTLFVSNLPSVFILEQYLNMDDRVYAAVGLTTEMPMNRFH